MCFHSIYLKPRAFNHSQNNTQYTFKARNSSPRKTRNFNLRKVLIAFAKPNMSITNI